MRGLLLLVVSVAVLDSLNPSTLGPALVFAAGRRARRDVTAFSAGVFAVSAAGGMVLLFGPGRELLARAAKPRPHAQHLIEVAVGAVLVLAAIVLWLVRARIGRRLGTKRPPARRSALLIGAAIMLVELPTAFPYFAVLVAVVESGRGAATDVTLVVVYNAIFVAPLLATLLLTAAGGAQLASALRAKLDRRAPVLVPAALGVIGAIVIAVGAVGLR